MAKLGSFILGIGQLLAGLFFTATGVGSGLGLKLIISGGLTIATGLKTRTGRDGFESSPRYGFDNLNNVGQDGGAVRVIYGKERIAPEIISITTEQSGSTQILRMLLLIGEGEIEGISDVRINDTPHDQFDDVKLTTRLGTADQTLIPGFGEIGTPWEAGTKIELGATHVHEMRNEGDAVVLNFAWLGGMYVVQKDGDLISAGWKVEIKIKGATEDDEKYVPATPYSVTQLYDIIGRPTGETLESGNVPVGTTWTSYGGGVFDHTKVLTQSLYRSQMRVNFPTRGRYTIKVTGVATADARYYNVPNLSNVVEILNDARAYPNRALLGLEIPAQAQLTGGTPRVTCLVKGVKVNTKPSDQNAQVEWSRNPVWCLRDFLLNERYGLGGWFTAADLDDGTGGTWEEAADACDDTLTGLGYVNPHPRHEIDLVLDTKAPGHDWVSQFTEHARLRMFMTDGLLRLRHAEARVATRLFSEDEGDGQRKNILAGVNSEGEEDALVSSLVDRVLPSEQQFSVVRVRYVDRHREYRIQTIEVRDDQVPVSAISGTFQVGEEVHAMSGAWRAVVTREAVTGDPYLYVAVDPQYDVELDASETITGKTSGATCTSSGAVQEITPERVLEIQLFGVTRIEQAKREARYRLNLATKARVHCSFAMFLGDQDLEPEDVIEITSSRLGWSAKKFLVLSVQWAGDGTGRLDCREYVASVFEDQLDRLEDPPLFTGAGDSITPGARSASSDDSSASEDEPFGGSGGGSSTIGTGSGSTSGSSSTTTPTSSGPSVDRSIRVHPQGKKGGFGQ